MFLYQSVKVLQLHGCLSLGTTPDSLTSARAAIAVPVLRTLSILWTHALTIALTIMRTHALLWTVAIVIAVELEELEFYEFLLCDYEFGCLFVTE